MRVDIRPAFLKRLLSPLLAERGSPVGPVWAASWDELAPVTVGPLSAVLRGSGRECRVIVVRRRRLEPLLHAARARALSRGPRRGFRVRRWLGPPRSSLQ